MWARILKGFALVWAAGVGILVALSVVMHVATAQSIWHGLADVQEWFSPFNLANLAVTALFFSPAIGAWLLAERMERQ